MSLSPTKNDPCQVWVVVDNSTDDEPYTITGDDEIGTYHVVFDPRESKPSQVLVAALGEVVDTPQMHLEPIYEVVDPEALDALCRSSDAASSEAVVTFRYAGFDVTVECDGHITLRREG